MPRTALATISTLSAAITMSAMVLLPAKLEFVDAGQRVAVARSMPAEFVPLETAQFADQSEAEFRKRNLDRRALAMHAAARE